MSTKGQEPAFPLFVPGISKGCADEVSNGMSTRLLIAAHLLQGLIAQSDELPNHHAAARDALAYADALIAEEEKTRTP